MKRELAKETQDSILKIFAEVIVEFYKLANPKESLNKDLLACFPSELAGIMRVKKSIILPKNWTTS